MLLWIYKLPLWVVIFSIDIAIILWTLAASRFENNEHRKNLISAWKIFNIVLAIASIVIVFYVTIINRTDPVRELHLEPFRLFKMAKDIPEISRSIIMNVALFLPFGLSFSASLPRKMPIISKILITFFLSVVLSISVEFLQFQFALGETEFDDVLCNSFGAFLGTLPFIIKRIYSKPI